MAGFISARIFRASHRGRMYIPVWVHEAIYYMEKLFSLFIWRQRVGLKEASLICNRRGPERPPAQSPWRPALRFSQPSARRRARESPNELYVGRPAAPVTLICSGLLAGREAVSGRIFRCHWKKVGRLWIPPSFLKIKRERRTPRGFPSPVHPHYSQILYLQICLTSWNLFVTPKPILTTPFWSFADRPRVVTNLSHQHARSQLRSNKATLCLLASAPTVNKCPAWGLFRAT